MVLYQNEIWMQALNDVWMLDVGGSLDGME